MFLWRPALTGLRVAVRREEAVEIQRKTEPRPDDEQNGQYDANRHEERPSVLSEGSRRRGERPRTGNGTPQ